MSKIIIDLDKEEFLQRFDARVHILASMLEFHEKHIAGMCSKSRSECMSWQKDIEKARKDILDSLTNIDNDIKTHFNEIRTELERQNEK